MVKGIIKRVSSFLMNIFKTAKATAQLFHHGSDSLAHFHLCTAE